jgi:hypothetical protein
MFGHEPRDELLRLASDDALVLAGEGREDASAFAGVIRAAVSSQRADGRDEAIAELERSASGFAALDMRVWAALSAFRAVELRRGQTLDDLASARARLSSLRIGNVERFARIYAPGFATA